MTRALALKSLAVLLLGALVVWGTGEAYRAYVDDWQGELRAPLIAGSLAGIFFIIFGGWVVRRCDRESRAAGSRDGLGR